MPPFDRRQETIEFAAPIGTRVRWMTLACLVGLGGGIMILDLALGSQIGRGSRGFWPMIIQAPLALFIILAIALYAQIRKYRLTPDELQVHRRWKIDRYAIGGLESVTVDRAALKGARKRMGNDGLGAVTGRFTSAKLGKFDVFVSDPARAVVLHWPEHCVVVSPDQPESFAEEVRARARLRR